MHCIGSWVGPEPALKFREEKNVWPYGDNDDDGGDDDDINNTNYNHNNHRRHKL